MGTKIDVFKTTDFESPLHLARSSAESTMAVKDAVKEPAAAVVENAVVFISTGTQTELGVAHGETSPVSQV